MQYRYAPTLSTDTQGGFIARPLLEIEMIGVSGVKRQFALLDSGADLTLVNQQHDAALGIDIEGLPTKRFIGIGEREIITRIGSLSIRAKGFDQPLTIPVAFTDSDNVDVLLGQEGFFDAFHVTFKKDESIFELKARI